MPYKSFTFATKNENGDAEVRFEHYPNFFQVIFGLTPKEEVYIAPHDWRSWAGLSVWRDKRTKKFVSAETTIRIIQSIHSLEVKSFC